MNEFEMVKKADVMRIINAENAVVLSSLKERSTDEVLCAIAAQINSLQTIQTTIEADIDRAAILRLCNEIEDIATEIQERTMKDSYFMAQTIINKVLVIGAEITAPPKSNADRIRQMTDEELAEWLDHVAGCGVCVLNEGKYRYS